MFFSLPNIYKLPLLWYYTTKIIFGEEVTLIPTMVNAVYDRVGETLKPYMSGWLGFLATGILLIGPITFLPTVWAVWTASNIDAFRTPTWPLLTLVNVVACMMLSQNGNWQMRLMQVVWVFAMASVWIATIVR